MVKELSLAGIALVAVAIACSDAGPPSEPVVGTSAVGEATEALTLSTSPGAIAGGGHSCAIVNGGQVKCWGRNDYGQLGYGDTSNRGASSATLGDNLRPLLLGAGRSARQLALGSNHTCALLDNGSVKCWGANGAGQLGLGHTNSVGMAANDMANLQPVNLGAGRTAQVIAAGYEQTCAILDTGQVKCWGRNHYGQLGLAIGNRYPTGRMSMGDQSGDMASLPAIDLGPGRTARAVAIAAGHTCALLDTSNVVCWGDNEDGNLGTGLYVDSDIHGSDIGDQQNELGANLRVVNLGTGRTAKSIDAGTAHTCAVLDTDDLKCWGNNQAGALGINKDDRTWGRYPQELGDNLPNVALGYGRKAFAVSLGSYSSCALVAASGQPAQVECWGNGSGGTQGNGDFMARGMASSPMDGATVRFGLPGIEEHSGVLAVSLGENHSCATLTNGWVKCWGGNGAGSLGTGDSSSRGNYPTDMGANLPFVNLGSRAVMSVALGNNATCAVTVEGRVRCWGGNDYGQLGQGDTRVRGDGPDEMGASLPRVDLGTDASQTPWWAYSVTLGTQHACALMGPSKLKCWGFNQFGNLGVGDRNHRGDNPAEMGNNLPFVDLGTGIWPNQVVAGTQYTCALMSNSQAKCWGLGDSGQLGGTGVYTYIGDSPSEMGNNLPFVNVGTGRSIQMLAGGLAHVCALLDNNQVKCWGYNGYGQLGLGDRASRGKTPGEMGDALPYVPLGAGRSAKAVGAGNWFSCALLDTNQIKCWGYNSEGELGQGHRNHLGDDPNEVENLPAVSLGTGRSVKQFGVGGTSVCAVLDNNQLKCWGHWAAGELGLGDTQGRGDDPGDMGDALPAVNLGTGQVADFVFGGSIAMHNCALLATGQLKCWGANGTGQLGQGDTQMRGYYASQMGDNLRVIDLGFDRPASCADGSVEQSFGATAVGCAGNVTFADRATLCAGGSRVCTASEWVGLREGAVPAHDYWTADPLLYSGSGMSCSVSKTVGTSCSGGNSMRICTQFGSDPEGNSCGWTQCGLNTTTPNQYFGGCEGNPTAGTLCCPP